MIVRAEDPANVSAPWPNASRAPAATGLPPFVWSVSPDGRHFLDQYGKPILVRGDSPWSMMTDLSPAQAELWFTNRQRHGFNAAIVSLIGSTGNGGPSDDGTTFDGLQPFVDGNVLRWAEPYWQRMDSYLDMARRNGITIFLYPIDGWNIGHSFKPASIEQCQAYGSQVAERFRRFPNIMWMSGGDYFPASHDPASGSDVDHCIDAMMRGIRMAGDARPFSIQLGYEKSISSDNPYWAARVNWNFIYTYYPTYRAVIEAYSRQPVKPALFGEANYERENNQSNTPTTTDQTLRQQLLWALTSGSPGDFYGSDDWEFHRGWESRLNTPAVTQISRLRTLFSELHWAELVPDTESRLVTEGRGEEITDDRPLDVLQNDYVTAARTPDGRQAVVYLPQHRTITVDRDALGRGATATWTDPTTGQQHDVPLADRYTSPGTNAAGGTDWLLIFHAPVKK